MFKIMYAAIHFAFNGGQEMTIEQNLYLHIDNAKCKNTLKCRSRE